MAALSPRSLPFFSCLYVIIILLSKTSGKLIDKYFCINDSGNYTTNSTYDTNLETLLSTITSNTKSNNLGFYNFSYGQDTDKVYAIAMCRADIKIDNCNSCLNNARIKLTQVCQNRKEAIGWYEDESCMLRYSYHLILYVMEIQPAYSLWRHSNSTSADEFNGDVKTLMTGLTSEAASGNSSLKYAAGTKAGPNNQTIYGLVQCTPDISELQCSSCLKESISQLQVVAKNSLGARIYRPSCILRYEANFSFYDPEAYTPPSLTTTTTTTPTSNHVKQIVIAVSVPVVVLSFILISFIVWKRRKRFPAKLNYDDDGHGNADDDGHGDAHDDGHGDGKDDEILLQLNFDSIRDATNGFSNKLGQGGFGGVYKGRFSNGREIAVKRLSWNSRQGDIEFKNEVLLVAKLQHRNLVRLLGFCQEGTERLLVYEFVANKSIDSFIFDPIKKSQLDWESRYKIIQGTARGILYLHEDSRLRIIHRDLKASNILIDEEMNPKIADFGMAKVFGVDQTQGHRNTRVGTYGYMAPETHMRGEYSVKSDIFSFGVLVLEIVSGRRNQSFMHRENMEDLLSFAWKNWRDRTALSIVDPAIKNGSENEIMRCIHIGLLCVQDNIATRPTVGTVVSMLQNLDSRRLAVPSQPGFFAESINESLTQMQSWGYNSEATRLSESTNRSAPESVNETSSTKLNPR